MNKVGEFHDAIQSFAPFSTAESWDNVGLLIGGRGLPVTRALLALDLTGAVLEEAVRLRAELVITHHPVIFKPLAALDSASLAYRAVAAGISVISAHTNLDLAQGGVNDALAARLQLSNIRPLTEEHARPYHKIVVFVPVATAQEVYEAMATAGAGRDGGYSHCAFFARGEGRFLPLAGATPAVGEVGRLENVEEVRLEMLCTPDNSPAVISAMRAAHPYEQPAFDVLHSHARSQSLSLGRVGTTEKPVSPGDLAAFVRERLGAAGVRYVGGPGAITTVAVCGGSGGGLLRAARAKGAQALVTGEAKHNELLEAAELGLTLVDAGHFATENVVMEPLRRRLSELLPGAVITISSSCTDGLRYVL